MNEFDAYDDYDEQEESAPIQVDLYGFKLSSKPAPTKDASSRITLRGLLDDVSQSLLRICRDSVGFLADVFTGARSLVRGIAALPAAVASRIGRAHQLSERREFDAQKQVSSPRITQESKGESVEQLEDILNELRAQGIPVRVDRLSSGPITISLVRPELEDIAPEIAADAVAGYIETMPPQPSPTEALEDILNIPVTDFELSVRTRNVLKKSGIRTLGDLTRTTEQQLLATKNFAETSLLEIRDMLASKGLELGQFAPQPSEPPGTTLSPDEEALPQEKPIANLRVGEVLNGRVTSVKDFGAFIEVAPGRDGLCHISEWDDAFVSNMHRVASVGDAVRVLILDIDDHDRVRLSRRRVLDQPSS